MKWLTELASRSDPGFDAGAGLEAAYLPRRLYGEYVEHTLAEAAAGSRARLTRLVGEAVSIEPDAAGMNPRIRMRDGSTVEYEVGHPSWRVWPAQDPRLDCDVGAVYGSAFVPFLKPTPNSAFVADGSPIVVRRGTRLSDMRP